MNPIADDVSRQLARFGGRYARRLAACAGLSERVAQLAFTHPVLFFALATGYGPMAPRREAVRRAVDGEGLGEVSAAVGLPLCFRRIAPESCRRPLSAVRWSRGAGCLLAPHIPEQTDAAAAWLDAISTAHRACDERFAVWLARQQELCPIHTRLLMPLAVFAWFSQQPSDGNGNCPALPWSPDLSLESALKRATAWLENMELTADLGWDGLADGWLPAGSACGYEFTPIVTAKDLIAEARAMRSCVVSYSRRLARNECRLFSMTHRGRRIATLEIRYSEKANSFVLGQMKGPCNIGCTLEQSHAAFAWLDANACSVSAPKRKIFNTPSDGRLEDLMAVYAAAHAELPSASFLTFADLRTLLARRARGVRVELVAFRRRWIR